MSTVRLLAALLATCTHPEGERLPFQVTGLTHVLCGLCGAQSPTGEEASSLGWQRPKLLDRLACALGEPRTSQPGAEF